MTPNEQIIHDLLTRQIDLMRYEHSVRREVLQRLEAMRREVEGQLRGQNLDEMGRRELAALLADIEAILSRDYDLISGYLNTAEVVEDESEWLFVWLGSLAAMYGLPEPKRLPETHKQAMQNGLLVGGLTIAEAFAGQRDALMSRIRAQVRMAAVGGSDWENLKTDLQAAFKRARQYAETTTATWISTIANQTTYWAGKANPWVKGYRHVSVLDSKTSSICTNRHGKLWNKQKQPQGHDFAFRVPPMHPNCRSRLVWVADLGDDFQGVSGEDWVKGRTLVQLQEQFGKGIGQMLHDGTISLHDAVRRGGLEAITLRGLRREHALSVLSGDFGLRFGQVRRIVAEMKSGGAELSAVRQVAQDKVWHAADLSRRAQSWLGAETGKVWLSEDTLIKQLYNHPELPLATYRRIPQILNQADLVVQVDGLKIAFVRKDEEILKAVVKTTQDREELYLVSLFSAKEKEMLRTRAKGVILFERETGG
ncbi:MAG: minor capsid protein [Eikenella sp.]|nr:minor capsid protein [Eikenella sp.]